MCTESIKSLIKVYSCVVFLKTYIMSCPYIISDFVKFLHFGLSKKGVCMAGGWSWPNTNYLCIAVN